jgi:hypothetical protein
MTNSDKIGLRRGLTHYGDPDFALYLRRSFARRWATARPCSSGP